MLGTMWALFYDLGQGFCGKMPQSMTKYVVSQNVELL